MDRHTSILEQDALASLINNGVYERHVRRIRRKNGARRAALLKVLSDSLGDSVTVAGADAGLHVVIWLNHVPRKIEEEFLVRAHVAGLGLYAVAPLYDAMSDLPDRLGLIMGYAALDERSITRGVHIIAGIIRELETAHKRRRVRSCR